MKLTKKLIPALGMLVLSACMLVTSTFAWFSMNDTVKATGMSVTAKGEQVYLQIINPNGTGSGDNNDKVFVPGKAQTVSNATTEANKALLPTNVYKTFDATSPTPYDGLGADMVWVTAIGKSNTDGTKSGNYENKTTTADGTLYIKNTFSIRLDPTAGAANSSAPLKVKTVTVGGETADVFEDCLSVLVVCTYDADGDGDGTAQTQGDLWDYKDGMFAHNTATQPTLTDGNLTKDTVATVDIYVFFNGDNANCTLEKLGLAANSGYTVEVTFTCV